MTRLVTRDGENAGAALTREEAERTEAVIDNDDELEPCGACDGDGWIVKPRVAPEVQRQLDDLQPDPDLPDVNGKIARMARSLCEFEQCAFAAGYELGPTVYEFESGPNNYRASATRELRPRGR